MEVKGHSGSDRLRVEARALAEQIAGDKFLPYERAAVARLRSGLPKTELEEDLEQEVRLHALVATHKFDPKRGAAFATFLVTYLQSKVTNHLLAFYRPMRNPNSVKPLEFDPKGDSDHFQALELEELRERLTPSTRNLLEAALNANSFDLRRKLRQGRANAALGALTGASRPQVVKALAEIREEVGRTLCSA